MCLKLFFSKVYRGVQMPNLIYFGSLYARFEFDASYMFPKKFGLCVGGRVDKNTWWNISLLMRWSFSVFARHHILFLLTLYTVCQLF